MTAIDTRKFMALMAITQHHGRPGTPTDQAHIESFFSHLKGDWPHLVAIRDPAALDAELARVRREYNTVRLHALDRVRHPRRRASRPRPQHPSRSCRGVASRACEPDRGESSQQDMTRLLDIDRARSPLGKRGAFEAVARWPGMASEMGTDDAHTPTTNRSRRSTQRVVEKPAALSRTQKHRRLLLWPHQPPSIDTIRLPPHLR
jgi:hypothetical protein